MSVLPDLYLVIQRMSFDEVPLGLFASEVEANEFAQTVRWDAAEKIAHRCGFCISDPASIMVVKFRNGKPVKASIVREIDNEEVEA